MFVTINPMRIFKKKKKDGWMEFLSKSKGFKVTNISMKTNYNML
jgi:hypothetical protein